MALSPPQPRRLEDLNSSDLVVFLRRVCSDVDDETFDMIIKHKVSGKRAKKYTAEDWTSIGLPYGDVKDIMSSLTDYDKEKENSLGLAMHNSNDSSKGLMPDHGLVMCSGSSILSPSKQAGSSSSSNLLLSKAGSSGSNLLLSKASSSGSNLLHSKASSSGSNSFFSKASCSGSNSFFSKASCSGSNSLLSKTGSCNSNVSLSKGSCSSNSLLVKAISNSGEDLTSRSNAPQQNTTDTSSKYESIKQYFDEDDFSDMPDYEIESYINQKELYEHGVSLGLRIGLPGFMRSPPKKRTKVVKEPQVEVPPSSMTLRTRKDTGLAPTLNDLSSENSESSKDDNFDFGKELEANEGNDSSSAEDVQQSTEDLSKANEQPENPKGTKRRRRRRQKPYEHLSEEDYVKTLPKFNVFDILKSKGTELKNVCKTLKKDGVVYGPQRKLMMRTLTRHLFFNEKGEVNRVTTEQKSGMAASVVAEYPLFKDGTDPSKRTWWRIFDPTGPSGFIANCTTTIFRSMNSKDRPRGGGQGFIVYTDDDSEEEPQAGGSASTTTFHDKDAEWMSLTMPFPTKNNDLVRGMESSFAVRRQWIVQTGPSITDILKKYPHLMSYGTEMLENEFNAMFPSKGPLFLRNFPRLVKLVKEKTEIEEVDFDHEETKDIIGTCLTLAKKLPRPNLQRYKRKHESVMPTLETLILPIPVGTNVKDIIDQKRKDAKSPVQPYLIAFTPAKRITRLYLVADSEMLELPQPSLITGLDLLFKAFFVFNVQYPLGWKVFWEMIEYGLCQINPQKLTNSAKELLQMYQFTPV
ncbi:Histone-lysine N-methyltransferase PRDM9 [Frankliniella fusca]|uniref:Histone-lysine N-methyltransferase PRDM9 n=1 Tax=Frankliniella fusca TaxID=407009 RepID=A0AAE1HG64_9NEOP|nr:Histone-lysine N-methyltransferase PRDM9 [Frankliniella fusca]